MERKQERLAALVTAADRLGRKFEATDLLSYPKLLNLASDWLRDEPRPRDASFTQEMWDQVNGGNWLTNGQAKGVLNVIVARERFAAQKALIPDSRKWGQFDWNLSNVANGRYRVEFGDGSSIAVRLSDMDIENGTEWARKQPKGTRNVSLLTQGADGWTGAGFVTADGQPSRSVPQSVKNALEILAKAGDTLVYGVAFARMGNQCFICGRNLDTAESIDAGYGPVCADKYGLPWGDKKTPAEVVSARSAGAHEEAKAARPEQPAAPEDTAETISQYAAVDADNQAYIARRARAQAEGRKLTYEEIFGNDY